MTPVPVSVITGFLGSGKTTLLSHLLRDPALERTAVIVNEFGEVGLDHLLLEASDEEVVLLEGGCLCCKVRGDLVRTAGHLLARRARGEAAFERIVVETTGLADPAPILQALMTDREIAEALRLESVIATVDCAAGDATLDAHPESVKQAAPRPTSPTPRRAASPSACAGSIPPPRSSSRCTARSMPAAFSTVRPTTGRCASTDPTPRAASPLSACAARSRCMRRRSASSSRCWPSIAAPGCCG
jgi:Ni2+-binding GTPase involved in maturation of urease and hydrogenase